MTCSPRPRPRKAGRLASRSVIQPKFWLKKPVMKLSGRNTEAMMVSCFMTPFRRFECVDE
jgi:hypothetical protein